MAVRIRLRKSGKSSKKNYHFRIVVADQRKARDGRFIEEIGYYNPAKKPVLLKLDIARADYWLKCGAVASDTVASLIKKAKKEKQ
ncbi:MAG: 30S ribosomal protein S16 [Candidatus Omnitrophica bacterium]|nr:30S ribosomal protein S16 [Candidatus Omnitrophota bacterium]